jgi:AcrR family transcriptional regulator
MSSSSRPVLLAGQELGEQRHVVALFNSVDEAHEVVLPFLADGLANGERAVYVLDPDAVPAHLAHLRDRGVNVDDALASGQLRIINWYEGPLRHKPFSPEAAFGFIREAMTDGRAAGYPLTRLVGDMTWTLDREVRLDDLVRFEARVERLALQLPDALVCAYVVNKHSAAKITSMLSVHAAALVSGELRLRQGVQAVSTPRERILSAASQLFPNLGTRSTSVDALIDRAGVAKATFYRHFPSKDDLIVAWLRDPRTDWWEPVKSRAMAVTTDPEQVIPLLFETVAEWLEDTGFRGCAYVNTSIELPSDADPARTVIREFLDRIETDFRNLLDAGGYRDQGIIARQLQTLLTGAISLGVARRTTSYALAARDAAQGMLADAVRASRPKPVKP